jgi:catechol 2,3-dioxygenase-like lactoylglutathione lyase family enzyme
MIDHTGVNVSDIKKSKTFYQKALAPIGYSMLVDLTAEMTGGYEGAGFGVAPKPDFWIGKAAPQKPHVHVAFRAQTRQAVDEFYRAALAAGGRDNGEPGPRPHYHEKYYGAFVLDPDGHNIEVVCHE